MQKIITMTTDLGDQFAAAQLKAVCFGLGFRGELIENHGVTPFAVSEGAFEIKVLSQYCPKGTVHVGIVDPGVGSSRRGIIIKTRSFWFVGPDNGLFYPAVKEQGVEKIWKIKMAGGISNTFHGRDVFIKAAVYLAQGKEPESFGSKEIKTIKKIAFKNGQVVHIDHYGNIKIHSERKTNSHVDFRGERIPFVKTFADVKPGRPLVYQGSSKTLELAINLGRADETFRVKLGDIIL